MKLICFKLTFYILINNVSTIAEQIFSNEEAESKKRVASSECSCGGIFLIWFYKKEGILNILLVWIYSGIVSLGRATKKNQKEQEWWDYTTQHSLQHHTTQGIELGNGAAVPAQLCTAHPPNGESQLWGNFPTAQSSPQDTCTLQNRLHNVSILPSRYTLAAENSSYDSSYVSNLPAKINWHSKNILFLYINTSWISPLKNSHYDLLVWLHWPRARLELVQLVSMQWALELVAERPLTWWQIFHPSRNPPPATWSCHPGAVADPGDHLRISSCL